MTSQRAEARRGLRLARLAVAGLAAGLGALLAGCAPSERDWISDLRDRDPFVRTLALVALEAPHWQDAERITERLLPLLADESEAIRLRAQGLVRSHAVQALPFVLQHVATSVNTLSPELSTFVEEQGAAAIPALQRALTAADAPGGPQLVWLLGRLGSAADEALIGLTRDERPAIRLAAVRALVPSATRSVDALAALLDVQRRDSQSVELALPACVKALALGLISADRERAAQSSRQLDELGPAAWREILAQLDGPRPGVRQAVAAWCAARRERLLSEVLPAYHSGDAEPTVLHYLDLARHISVFGDAAAEDLVAALAAPEAAQAIGAVVALGGFGGRGDATLTARAALLARLDDASGEFGVALGYALLQLGLPEDELERLAHLARSLPPEPGLALGAAVAGQLLRDVGLAETEAEDADLRHQQVTARLQHFGADDRRWLRAITLWAVDAELRHEAARALDRLAPP